MSRNLDLGIIRIKRTGPDQFVMIVDLIVKLHNPGRLQNGPRLMENGLNIFRDDLIVLLDDLLVLNDDLREKSSGTREMRSSKLK